MAGTSFEGRRLTSDIVRIKGARELRAALRKAGDDLQDLKEVNLGVAKVVAGAAKQLVPYSTRTAKKKHLRETIKPFGSKTRARIAFGGKAYPYTGPVHWGWPARGQAAQPFASDAATVTESIWIKKYEDRLAEIVDKIGASTP
ncbi:hypothetical protein ACL1G7_13195 [Corynebacterium striatum]